MQADTAVQHRADIIAALTPNDVSAMGGSVITNVILDALTPAQMYSILRFLAGYTPAGFARAVYRLVDPEQIPEEQKPERPLEATDIAWDRTHPDPFRTWVNGEPPASDAS